MYTSFRKFLIRLGVLALCSAAPVAGDVFTTDTLRLTIDAQGKASSLMDLTTGVERIEILPQYRHSFCRVERDGTVYAPTLVAGVGGLYTFTFADLVPPPVVAVRIISHPRYLEVRVESVLNESSIDELRFFDVKTGGSLSATSMRFMNYEDDGTPRCICVMPLDAWTESRLGPAGAGGYLYGVAHPNLPHHLPVSMSGRRIAVAACAGDSSSIEALAEHIEDQEDLPLGVAARRTPALNRNGFFWLHFEYADRDLVRQYAEEAGVGRILLHRALWQNPNRTAECAPLWPSPAALETWVSDCQASGMIVGAHAFPLIVNGDDEQYIRPGADPRLFKDRLAILAAPVPAGQTTGLIQTVLPPTGWPTDPVQRNVVIGNEIVEYTGIKTDVPPYGFLGPFVRAKHQTGPGGLGPRNWNAGTVVGHLIASDGGNCYEWDLTSGGVALNVANSAAVLDQIGFDYVYTDDVESPAAPERYLVGYTEHLLYQMMTRKPAYMESSGHSGWFSWTMIAVVGQIDYRWTSPFINEVNRNVDGLYHIWAQGYRRQLGWAMLSSPDNLTDHVPVEQLEYLLSRGVAHDVPIMFLVRSDRMAAWPHREANLRLIRQYEEVRLSGALTPAEREALQPPNRTYLMFPDGQGGRKITLANLLSLPGYDSQVRGFVSTQQVGGRYCATLWPLDDDANLSLYLDGVLPGDVDVRNFRDEPVGVTEVDTAVLRIPLRERLYFRFNNVADPQAAFMNATIR